MLTSLRNLSLKRGGGVFTAAVRQGGQRSSPPPAITTLSPHQQCRELNVHEYHGIQTMRRFGIGTPEAIFCETPEEAEEAYADLTKNGGDAVIKAQVLCGGRGLGTFTNGFQGGVHLVTRPGVASDMASKMLGHNLVTKQTTADGLTVSKVMMMERVYMRREMYVSILLDRAANGPVMVASPAGGTSIEDVAEQTPELIFKQAIDVDTGLTPAQAEQMASNLGFDEGTPTHAEAASTLVGLYAMFCETDSTMVEVNPLGETPDGRVLVCDAKLNFDDNAEFRQGDIFEMRDFSQEDPRDVEASNYDLNYIGLDGNIACMVNGAGLAMSTMDIIKLHGGTPANFLDVGGASNKETVQKAFEIINGDPQVKAILVNIFGGIVRCDIVAEAVVAAAKELNLEKPVIIRLKGTNFQEARDIIANSGVPMITTDDLDDAANKAARIAKILRQAEKADMKVAFSRY